MTSHDPHEEPTLPGVPGGGDEGATRAAGRSGPRAVPPEERTAAAPPASDAQATANLLGKVLGGCRIDVLLGRGAMGAVYKAEQLKLGRDVAVKVIRPEMMADPRTLKRFEVEARIVGKFNSPNVVMVHDVGFELGVHYLVMEFVQGKNLREHAKLLPHGRLPAGEALPLLRQACKGLDDARRLGVVHRDIKPDNLMLTDQGVLKIADFGIAKPAQDDFNMTLTSELIGTPLYMSPEQCHGGAEIDFRSDMYSLGATFFYLLTGEPPIRASSVYELIQTKTKLENLCLWKALPELDENHPLSRVIERMTANDREDRYDSYEQLLNDLVLVEAGGTITLPQKRAKRKSTAAAPAERQRRRSGKLVAGVVALVVLGGAAGGYAFYASQPEQSGTDPATDVAAAQARLDRLRSRLQGSGPDAALLADVDTLAVPAALAAAKQRLRLDIEVGQAVAAKLAAIAVPTDLELPFDRDLGKYLEAVALAGKLDADCGDEVSAWCTRAVLQKRALVDTQLGPLALSRLIATFSTWGDDRRNAGGDKERLAALAAALDRIEAGRRKLYDLVPSQRAAIDRDLPVNRLDEARRGLSEDQPVVPSADVEQVLQEVRSQFEASGPSAALRTRVDDLRPGPQQLEARRQLQNALETASKAKDDALATRTASRPSPPKLPFDDVDDYYKALDRALLLVREPDGELPPWAAALRTELREATSLGEAALGVCVDEYAAWQRRAASGSYTDEARRMAERLRNGVRRAQELFPELAERFAAAVPEARFTEQRAGAERASARQELLDAVGRLQRRVGDLRSLEAWGAAAGEIEAELERLRTAGEALAGDDAVTRALGDAAASCDRWRAAATAFVAAAAELAAGDLTRCAATIEGSGRGSEGRAELQRLDDIRTSCRAAFDVLERSLAIEQAKTELAAAAKAATGVPGLPAAVGQRVRAWQAGVAALDAESAGMVPIPAGRTRAGAAESAFFLAGTECNRGDFQAFVDDVRAQAVGADDTQRLAAVADRLAGAELTPALLRRLLGQQVTGARDLPAERVLWHEAAAFAAWHRKALPTEAEWMLAAFGDGNQHEFPWDADSAKLSDQLSDHPVSVADGGFSWRSKQLHHLGGNVAEWLAAGPGREAKLAGGRYNLAFNTAKEQAKGRCELSAKDDTRAGFGFRVVLRPKSFSRLEWPR